MEFKERVKALRKKRKLSQAQLADKIGVSAGTVGFWETGARMPSVKTQEALASFFNVSLDYLLCREDDSPYYLDPEIAEYAEFLRTNPEYRILFDTTRKVSKDDIDFVRQFLEKVVKDE